MQKLLGVRVLACVITMLSVNTSQAQIEKSQRDPQRPNKIIRKTGTPTEVDLNGSKLRLLADSSDTHGAWSCAELTENPGYKTQVHWHTWDESFYVLNGTLTAMVNDSDYVLPAGSYLLIPRGTPHAQGNFAKEPVRLLLTMRPSGFEKHLKDRIELYKTVKPGDEHFAFAMDSLRKKNAAYIQVIRTWDGPKAIPPANKLP
jgi:mannose-6-phosphate isomerase-like protein (cupin superfamily)